MQARKKWLHCHEVLFKILVSRVAWLVDINTHPRTIACWPCTLSLQQVVHDYIVFIYTICHTECTVNCTHSPPYISYYKLLHCHGELSTYVSCLSVYKLNNSRAPVIKVSSVRFLALSWWPCYTVMKICVILSAHAMPCTSDYDLT